jgi:hypothetical protein
MPQKRAKEVAYQPKEQMENELEKIQIQLQQRPPRPKQRMHRCWVPRHGGTTYAGINVGFLCLVIYDWH